MTVVTVGHGTRTSGELGELLLGAGVSRLVDVRRYPASRRNPHLAADPLAAALAEVGVDYEWWGEHLGGRRRPLPDSRHRALTSDAFRGYADHMDTAGFRQALELLVARSAERGTAVMCAETLWWRCHRRLIADAALVARGASVRHLLHDGSLSPHAVTDGARPAGAGVVYDAGAVGQLPGLP